MLDFDAAMYGWYALDVAIALEDVWRAGGSDRDERVTRFCDGYALVRPLPAGVHAMLPRFLRLLSAVEMARLLHAYATTDDASASAWVRAMADRYRRWLSARRAELTISQVGTTASRSFEVVVERDARGRVVIPLPFDPAEQWGPKARHHVAGTVGERRVRGPLAGAGTGASLVLGTAWCRDAGLATGERVRVVLWPEGPQGAGGHEQRPAGPNRYSGDAPGGPSTHHTKENPNG